MNTRITIVPASCSHCRESFEIDLQHDEQTHPHAFYLGPCPLCGRNNHPRLHGGDIVGVYPNYATAYAAWKGLAQRTVDNALMRYFIVHMHRLLDPATDATRQKT